VCRQVLLVDEEPETGPEIMWEESRRLLLQEMEVGASIHTCSYMLMYHTCMYRVSC
jgi:hypothetical protein